MNERVVQAVLAVALVISVGMHWLRVSDKTRPRSRSGHEMSIPVAAESFAPNSVFPNGQTLQRPVSNTVARDFLPFPYEPTRLGGLLAGQELSNPFAPDDAAALERGAEIYDRFCATCHGPEGEGDGPVVARGYPAPPSFHTALSRRMRDGQMYHIVTYGRSRMASFASRIRRDDRWKAILHVRRLQALSEAGEQSVGTP